LYKESFEKLREEIRAVEHHRPQPKSKIKCTDDLRYDHQKLFNRGDDCFGIYAAQANMGADNKWLKSKALKGNVKKGKSTDVDTQYASPLSGSTIASINVQQNRGRVSPKRAAHALGHSAIYNEQMWVMSKEGNELVPEEKKKHSGIYHLYPHTVENNKKV
jgi:hypothetical protein